MARLRPWIYLLAIAVLAGVALGVYQYSTDKVPVRTAEVSQETIREFVEERAKTVLPWTYKITMPTDGRIAAIDLEPGDRVTAGQVVARFVQPDLQIARRRAEAEVARIEAEIRKAEDDRIEQVTLKQTVALVSSVNDMVQAAAARVVSGKKKYETAVRNRQRVEALARTGARSAEDLDDAELSEVTASVEYDTDQLVHSSMRALQTLIDLMPTLIRRQIERKSLDVDVFQQQRDEAQAALDKLELDTGRAEMTSPVDGVVLTREYRDEQPLAAGTVLMTIGRLDTLEVEAEILSQEAVRIEKGDTVEIFGAALGGKTAAGQVVRVEPAGFTKRSSLGVEQQRVPVRIAFSAEPQSMSAMRKRLGVGYRVRVRIVTDQRKEATVIPRSALLRSSTGDWQAYVVRDGQVRLTTVQVGLMNDDQVEIVEPLEMGQHVVIAPESTLADDDRVRIEN